MPTTSNFGWTTPADTDLVKDGAAAIRTLGNGIDTSFIDLKGGTTGQVLAKASNTDLDFSWVAQDDSNAIQNALLTTTGDTIYASAASTPARLGIGTTGQVLTVSGGVPIWATPAGGKVLQVIQATHATTTTVASTTFTDTGLSASITPSSTNSKVLVLVNQTINIYRDIAGIGMGHRLLRGVTTIYDPAPNRTESLYTSGNNMHSVGNIIYLDSPSTTSSTTYKTQIAASTTANSGQCASSPASGTSTIILMEIGA